MKDFEKLSDGELLWLFKLLLILLIILVASTIGFGIGLLIRTFIGG